jgi:hypothetical protein
MRMHQQIEIGSDRERGDDGGRANRVTPSCIARDQRPAGGNSPERVSDW